MTPRVARLFDDYAHAHRTRGNRVCHSIGIPLIVFSAVLALAAIPIAGRVTAAEAVVALVSIVEITLDPEGGLVFLLFAGACDVAARIAVAGLGPRAGLVLAALLFTGGWAFQLVGHSVFEKNRPAFARNLRHLLVGPLWIARKALGRAAR